MAQASPTVDLRSQAIIDGIEAIDPEFILHLPSSTLRSVVGHFLDQSGGHEERNNATERGKDCPRSRCLRPREPPWSAFWQPTHLARPRSHMRRRAASLAWTRRPGGGIQGEQRVADDEEPAVGYDVLRVGRDEVKAQPVQESGER